MGEDSGRGAATHSRCSPHVHSCCSFQALTEASGAATAPVSAAAPSLQVPSQSLQPPFFLTGTARGWMVRGRRRDDDDATTSTGKTLTSRDSLLLNLGCGVADGAPQCSPRQRPGFSGLAGRRGGDAAGRGAVGRHRRPGRCGSCCLATSGSCPRCRTPSTGRRCSACSSRSCSGSGRRRFSHGLAVVEVPVRRGLSSADAGTRRRNGATTNTRRPRGDKTAPPFLLPKCCHRTEGPTDHILLCSTCASLLELTLREGLALRRRQPAFFFFG